uniref:Adenosine 3'-phospho 5'-phosphosulfate transporter 2 n=1 Tax=Schmidtea mediterranea TaxID=79327 RepID=A0A0H3YFJ6_SCHMD|nr:slc35b-2 [Schmidtea mediterranea]
MNFNQLDTVKINFENSNSYSLKVPNDPEVIVLGFDISKCKRSVQFITGCVGLFVFYIVYGYLQERIFLIPNFKLYGWYLTWFQFCIYSLLGLFETYISGITHKEVPWKIYVLIAFLTVCTMGLSNSSVGYLNYPTQVIFKCCKLIPTMIGGVLIQRISYNKLDITSVLLMVVGLIWFILAETSVQPNFNLYGVLLISLALCADGAIGNVQEKTMKKYSLTTSEMVLYSYTIGLVMISLGLIVSGQFVPAFTICAVDPFRTYGMFIIFSLSGYFGIQFVLMLVKNFGALPAVTVSTCRKAVTIILSFLFFQKPYTMTYLYAGLVVLLGIYLNLYSKNESHWKPKINNFILQIVRCCLKWRKEKNEIIV